MVWVVSEPPVVVVGAAVDGAAVVDVSAAVVSVDELGGWVVSVDEVAGSVVVVSWAEPGSAPSASGTATATATTDRHAIRRFGGPAGPPAWFRPESRPPTIELVSSTNI